MVVTQEKSLKEDSDLEVEANTMKVTATTEKVQEAIPDVTNLVLPEVNPVLVGGNV